MEPEHRQPSLDKQTQVHWAMVRSLLPPLIFSLACLAAAQVNYLLFHSLAEIFSIVIGFTAMVITTTAARFTRNHFIVFISIAIGWCSGIDLLHTLVFKGMGLLPDDSANPSTQLWVAARYLQAIAFVMAPWVLRRRYSTACLHAVFGGTATLLTVLVVTGHFPDAFVDGQGLTPFKVYSEYLIIALLGLSVVQLHRNRGQFSQREFSSLAIALVAMMLSEFSFTRYATVYAQANLVGHLLKIFAYWFVYIALIRNTIREPFMQLRQESQARQELAAERGNLLIDLGERIKELRALNAILELSEKVDLDLNSLLQGSALRLSIGFMLPELAQVHINSDWGQFGATLPAQQPRHELTQPLMLEGRRVGLIRVWYPDTSNGEKREFLPEEETLLVNVARLICDAIKRLIATERAERMRYLYEMLSKANHAAVHSRTPQQLLDSLYTSLVEVGTFPMFYVAETTLGGWPLKLTQKQGIPATQTPALQGLLTNPHSPIAKVLETIRSGEVSSETIESVYKGLAIANIPQLSQWRDFLASQGIVNRAVLPLRCNGTLLGIVVLYARGLAAFDAEQLKLLQEISAEMGFALDNLERQQQTREAQALAARMESQFEQVFKASPVPMMISSVDDRSFLAINDALQKMLGYEMSEIATEDAWFERVYPDASIREELQRHWRQSVREGLSGQSIPSPLVTLRCKDGSSRLVSGRMTVIGRNAIVAWTDLTEIHKGEVALLESERRFRSMVEQTLAAMYVRRNGLYIYVNPRYSEMTGWDSEELIGQPVLNYTEQTPENIEHIRHVWTELHESEHASVTYTVPFRCKDGRMIDLGLTAKVITWDDGQPATIVLATDITEQKRAEKQTAEHLRQLEASMRGTLQAVSSMVEMRDPYTAGHERRVGLIASAIAREMGWNEERCQNLELLGLVHDIGKIAIPSEILTKPTRLTPLEMQMMRGHAQAGYEILKNVPFPTPVADIIHQHHERMDGSGYPQGLKGEQILPEARILAVADVLESMASHRPYRPAVGLESALDEVVRNKGNLYDAEVVDAAIHLILEKGYQLPT